MPDFKQRLTLAVTAVVLGVIIASVPGKVAELTARADHSNLEFGVAVVYEGDRSIIETGLKRVRDCDAIIEALPVGNDVAHFECVRVR